MDYFKQTRPDNCLETCIAILTKIPIESFPDLSHFDKNNGNESMTVLNEWLVLNHSLYCETLIIDCPSYYKRGIVIALGDSPRTGMLHAVLWDYENYGIVFDPSPANDGLKGKPSYFGVIINYFKNLKE